MMNARVLPVPSIAADVRRGLTSTPKTLPPRLFYDARGSELFEEITRLPQYYLTATERKIFEANAGDILTAAGRDLRIVELGAGSAAKTIILLRELARRQDRVSFYPVDVSSAALEEAEASLNTALPDVELHPVVADYTLGLPFLHSLGGRKLILYIGSSIGNFEPMESAAMLARLSATMSAGDALLLGTDMRKSTSLLIPAYDDDLGVTAAFNKNILVRINRELDADFDVDAFAHRAIWNAAHSRMEMHLESVPRQQVVVGALGLSVRFEAGETIHTENSYKFTEEMIASIARNADLEIERRWQDPRGWFTVHLLRR